MNSRITDTFSKRFQELKAESDAITFPRKGAHDNFAPNDVCFKWTTSVASLIKAVFGDESPHVTSFENALKRCSDLNYTNCSESNIKALQGIFLSAKEAFEGGYIFRDITTSISGEVLGDFILLAKEALKDGHKDVAAVLACAALEDVLKRHAQANGLNVDSKSMSDVINMLKSKGLVSGARKSLLGSMPPIRNYALHANWNKISEAEVGSLIGFVEQYLLYEFSQQ